MFRLCDPSLVVTLPNARFEQTRYLDVVRDCLRPVGLMLELQFRLFVRHTLIRAATVLAGRWVDLDQWRARSHFWQFYHNV